MKLSHCRVASSPMVRYHFVGIEGAHCGLVAEGGKLMECARILACITDIVDQELLLRNEYLAAENRILRAPPAAERWAFTCVESIICVSLDRPLPANSRNTFSQMPRRAQRTKRL